MLQRRIFLAALLSVGAAAVLPAEAQGPAPARPEQAAPRRELIEYLNARAVRQLSARRAEVAKLRTREQAERRAAELRAVALELIGGLPAERGPVAVRHFGTVDGDGFRVEKLAYESLPGLLVTANLYLPTGRSGPFPAVLLTPGHSPNGKVGQHSFAANFARAGIAALAWDPISEGERFQHFDPERGASRVGGVTGEHGHAGVQTMLLGEHVSRYFVHDAMRGIDYLQGRPEIDGERIGAFGCSGGGTVTAYLAALDPRVKAAATACYLTTFEALLTGGDPQEAEQSIPWFIERGLDFADWVEMAAPRPYAVVSTTEDMFPFEGARRTYEEARRVYDLYGAGDRVRWITGPGGHGALGPVSAEIVGFFTRWLANDTVRPAFARIVAERPDDLRATATGQLSTSIGSETIWSVNRKRAAERVPARPILSTAAELERLRARLREEVRAVARVEARPGAAPPPVRVLGDEARTGYRLQSVEMQSEAGIRLAGLLALPRRPGRRPALLVMDSRPGEEVAAPGGEVERLARAGWVVLVLQPRGMPGGTEEIKSQLLGNWYLLSLRAMLVGKTIVGMRVDDALRAVDWLAARPEVDRAAISLHGVGPHGAVALHAAALDPRIAAVYAEGSLAAYSLAVERPLHRNLPEVALPGVLPKYDLPDLVLAAAARRVVLIDPVDEAGERLSPDAARALLARALESDRRLGRPARVEVATRAPGAPLPVR